MMSHLKEIDDIAARDGVFTFQTQMELMVLGLLDHDRAMAVAQIEGARTALFDHIEDLGSGMLSTIEHAKSARLATAMLRRSFERLRLAIAAPDNGSPESQ